MIAMMAILTGMGMAVLQGVINTILQHQAVGSGQQQQQNAITPPPNGRSPAMGAMTPQ